jgi:hypothetical protein
MLLPKIAVCSWNSDKRRHYIGFPTQIWSGYVPEMKSVTRTVGYYLTKIEIWRFTDEWDNKRKKLCLENQKGRDIWKT